MTGRYPCKHCGLSHSTAFVPMKCIEAASRELIAMTKTKLTECSDAVTAPLCPHGYTYGTCQMCFDLGGEQQSEIGRLQHRLKDETEVCKNPYAEIERLQAALIRYGKHDSGGMSDQPGCQKTRMGGGPCTCGLEEAMR